MLFAIKVKVTKMDPSGENLRMKQLKFGLSMFTTVQLSGKQCDMERF